MRKVKGSSNVWIYLFYQALHCVLRAAEVRRDVHIAFFISESSMANIYLPLSKLLLYWIILHPHVS
jgi:hypothetical protein